MARGARPFLGRYASPLVVRMAGTMPTFSRPPARCTREATRETA